MRAGAGPAGQADRAGTRGADLVRGRVVDRLIVTALLLGGVIMLLPFAWMFSTSWRLAKDSFSLPPQWWPTTWHVENYREVLENIPFVAGVSSQCRFLLTYWFRSVA